ncbi:hypothetical protein SAMD00023353_0102720 [Rosellinia necatrix]|uniref:Uncharacterized protein n=1 Tax=Rosellinia necatrix TaxID=77044 RepID=A0A1S7UHS1_ROSNE|nr:hypothetical protein SAMD00023353_0102720 [Rosellinia necatrix]
METPPLPPTQPQPHPSAHRAATGSAAAAAEPPPPPPPLLPPSASQPARGKDPITLHISDRAALAAAWRTPHPILTHLNADTTWVLHLRYPAAAAAAAAAAASSPPPGRSRFNVVLDPWLRGPQTDGGRWFSIQWHVVAPGVRTMAELDALLGDLERGSGDGGNDGDESTTPAGDGTAEERERERNGTSYIDAVAVSHEFTDHCHEATLRELPASTPVLAPGRAARLIRSWGHFDRVTPMPALAADQGGGREDDWRVSLRTEAALPSWLGIGRVVTPGNALYYHSALVVAWEADDDSSSSSSSSGGGGSGSSGGGGGGGEAIVYSPHGIEPGVLADVVAGAGLRTLALLHGLDDVRLRPAKRLNLGGVNGVAAARACRARYWVPTHDEPKKGGGLVALLLSRTRWSVADAEGRTTTAAAAAAVVVRGGEQQQQQQQQEEEAGYRFVDLGSGDALVLA